VSEADVELVALSVRHPFEQVEPIDGHVIPTLARD
jgi:hypothetical protein